jgi:Fic family protein
MALNIGKLIGTVSKIAANPNAKKAATSAKNAVSKKMQEKKTQSAAAVSTPTATPAPELNLSPEKVILQLAEKTNPLTLKQIISMTSLELDAADEAVKHLVAKGVATEQVGPDGKSIYDFS